MQTSDETRVLMRQGARELSRKEVEAVYGNGSVPCRLTFTHQPKGGSDEDTQCP
ncbi:MAG TPA: hypothetical protein VF532_12885 [Candidatus Angelobacter sp.]